MIFKNIQEVFVAQHRVDFRLGIFGMMSKMHQMELDPYRGDCCVFIHPNHRQLRIVGGSATGCWMLVKVFEAGALKKTFPFLHDPSFVQISKLELEMLFEGATFEVTDKVPDWVPCTSHRIKVNDRSYEAGKLDKREFQRSQSLA